MLCIEDKKNNSRQDFLIGCLKANDNQSFRLLHDALSKYIFFYAYTIVKNHHIAEDVVQETFASIWIDAKSYNENLGSPINWMRTIVRNKCIDALRRIKIHLGEEYFDSQGSSDNQEKLQDPYQELAKKQTIECIKRRVRKLSTPQMETIYLAFFDQMSHSEVAFTMAQPLGTVKNRIRLGLITLKRSEKLIKAEN